METAKIELTESELCHLINDTIAYIYQIKQSIFGHYNFGTKISEVKKPSPEQEKKLQEYGYYSRKELLDRLKKLERENFSHDVICG